MSPVQRTHNAPKYVTNCVVLHLCTTRPPMSVYIYIHEDRMWTASCYRYVEYTLENWHITIYQLFCHYSLTRRLYFFLFAVFLFRVYIRVEYVYAPHNSGCAFVTSLLHEHTTPCSPNNEHSFSFSLSLFASYSRRLCDGVWKIITSILKNIVCTVKRSSFTTTPFDSR